MKKIFANNPKLLLGIASLIATVWVLIDAYSTLGKGQTQLCECWKNVLVIIYLAWVLLPPIWFLGEYARYKKKGTSKHEHFIHDQELASRFWAAVLLALFIIFKGYFHIDFLEK